MAHILPHLSLCIYNLSDYNTEPQFWLGSVSASSINMRLTWKALKSADMPQAAHYYTCSIVHLSAVAIQGCITFISTIDLSIVKNSTVHNWVESAESPLLQIFTSL